MKLVARKDIINVKALSLKMDASAAGFKHADMVHKGHRFEIGLAPDFKTLVKTEPDQADLVAKLVGSQSVVPDNDLNRGTIAAIDAEVKAEQAALASAVKKANIA